jgi:hypothetical protein
VEVWLWLLFKVIFTWKCIKIIFFYFLKIIFDINTSKQYENTKNISIWSKKIKIIIFFKNAFETQKQTGFYETQLKKYVKTASQKLRFKLNFLVDPTIQDAVWFVTKYLAAFVSPQTQKLMKNKHSRILFVFLAFVLNRSHHIIYIYISLIILFKNIFFTRNLIFI